MTGADTSRASHLTRRSVLQSGAALGLASALPGAPFAASSANLHEDVARWVRELVGDAPGALSVLCPNGSQRNLDPIARAFTDMTGVSIELRSIASESLTTQIALEVIAGNSQFDVALPATYGLPDLAASGVILPLDQFVDIYEPPGFREGAIYNIGDTVEGRTYGFQTDGDAYVMFYNKALLENPDEMAGYEDTYGTPLTVPLTWAELDRQMAWFHRPDMNQWGGLLLRSQGYLGWEFWLRLHSYGIWPFSEDMVCQIDAPEGHAALADMIRSGQHLHPGVSSLKFVENWDVFSKGRTYCNVGWGGAQKSFNAVGSPLRGKLCYGPTPGGPLGPDGAAMALPYFNWGWSYVVNRESKRPRVSYLFSLFAASPEMSTRAVREVGGFFDPNRPEHYADPTIQDVYSKTFLDVHRASLEQAIPDLYLKGQSEYFRVLNEALVEVIAGDVDPQRGLIRAAQLWEMITSRSGRAEQIERWRHLRAQYPTAVSRSLRDHRSA